MIGSKEKLTREEWKELKAARKELRKDLKSKGIKSRAEFEQFARALGYGLPASSTKGLGLLFFLKADAIAKAVVATTGIYAVLGGGAAVLGATFLAAYVSETKGHFTINLTADMISQGYTLSNTIDFAVPSTRLYTEQLENINAISIQDISQNVGVEADGPHNGTGYVAYTFYIKNEGSEPSNYIYELNVTSETSGVLGATWIMLFEEEEQLIYAKISEDGDRENLYGYKTMPFSDYAIDIDTIYYEEDDRYGIVPVAFADEDTVAQGIRESMQPDEVHKYTVVIWIEGDDPQCTNDILGGHAGFTFQFEMVDDDEFNLFEGLYRQEYQDAQDGILSDEEDVETESSAADEASPILTD